MATATIGKQPTEVKTISVDFVNKLAEGDTLSALTSTTVSPSGLTLASSTVAGTVFATTLSGGTDETTYQITIIVTTLFGETLEAEINVAVADTPTDVGPFAKPTQWILKVSNRYLKYALKNLVPPGDERFGVSQLDLDAASDYAWQMMISHLIGYYDITNWSKDPPIPLFQIWDQLASAYIMRIITQRLNIEEGTVDTVQRWYNEAWTQLRRLTDPKSEGERLYLIKSDNKIQHPRSKTNVPVVTNPRGTVFFPATRDETYYGYRNQNNLEDIFKATSMLIL